MSFIMRTGLFLGTYLSFLLFVTILISNPFAPRVTQSSVDLPEINKRFPASGELYQRLSSPKAELWLHKESLRLEMDEEYDERVEAHRRGLLKWETSDIDRGGAKGASKHGDNPETEAKAMQGHV